MRAIRVPNKSGDSGIGDSTALNGSSHIRGKYSPNPGTLFQPKADRKNLMKDIMLQDTRSLSAYYQPRNKSRFRIAIGRIMFSHCMERFFFLLIILFAALVLVSVALGDDLGDAKVYFLSVELCILALFLSELILKMCAVGLV